MTPANADSYRADIRWNYDDGEYEGGFNWRHSTWSWQAADTPRVHAAYAKEATEEEQVLVFRKHENAGEWPQSVPACGG